MLGEGIVALMREGKWDAAITACQTCLQVQPVLGRIHALLGECHYQKKAYADAEPSFKRAYNLDPQLGDAAVRHAQCLEKLHRYREAMDVVKEWMRLRPNDNTLRGLFEFLETKPDAEEHDGWERTRRMSTNVINASFGREEPAPVGDHDKGHEADSTSVWPGTLHLRGNPGIG